MGVMLLNFPRNLGYVLLAMKVVANNLTFALCSEFPTDLHQHIFMFCSHDIFNDIVSIAIREQKLGTISMPVFQCKAHRKTVIVACVGYRKKYL